MAHGNDPRAPTAPLWQRLLWMAGIWAGSVLALGIIAFTIRAWLKP
jgi:hypothetical protein